MRRVLLLFPTTTYRTAAFLAAAQRLGLDVTVASEEPSAVERLNPAGLLTLDLRDPDRAAEQASEFAARHPIHAVVPVDDQATVPAAVIAARLGLPTNPAESVAAAQNKYLHRCRLRDHAVPAPDFQLGSLDDDLASLARRVSYPCIVKPLALSASRGVIRADNPDAFIIAAERLATILRTEYQTHPSSPITHHSAHHQFLVEAFVPGPEVALEGLLTAGRLHTLALFDKPEPLDGPYFEETVFLAPSRLSADAQDTIAALVQSAVDALGLLHGPIHAEVRLATDSVGPLGVKPGREATPGDPSLPIASQSALGTPAVIEINPRSIGGHCSRVLRFGAGMSLEELILRHALDPGFVPAPLQSGAAGVMMIPIPRAGTLEKVDGLDAAKAVPNIEDAVITAHPGQKLIPLPDAGTYLGFLFARGCTSDAVETALRTAHSQLSFHILPS